MKAKTLAFFAAVLASGLTAADAATSSLTAWTFDNLSPGANGNPQPSTGFGGATTLGMGTGSDPDIQPLPGSSTGGANSWRIRATGTNNSWSTNAAIASQGARFAGSTAGYYKIKVSFDVYATADAEANLLIQYTTEGSIWHNIALITSAGLGIVTNNTATNSTVLGSYVSLSSGWNNQIVAELGGLSGADNNPGFGIRMVNASTGTNCVDTTGAIYNNTSGSWNFDNVIIEGVAIDTVAQWTFESEGVTSYVPHPAPEFGSGFAAGLGMDNNYNFSDGSVGSTNKPDILSNGAPFSSSGANGQLVWRIRGAGAGNGHNGWNITAPIGTQGAEFDVSTANFDDVVVAFDLFSTSQGEAKMCVLYTTNGTTWDTASSLFFPSNPTFIFTNAVSSPEYSSDTVTGTYFWQNTGQNFYNNFVVDFTGVPGVANNTNFGIRIVNAAQGNDCLAYNGGSYNNSSGNWRYDNVTFGGSFNGSTPPVLAYDPNATVDGPFTNTFADDPAWRSKITAVYVNGSVLTNSAYTTNIAGQIVFTPSKSALLKSSGVKSIVFYATGYGNAKVTQPLAAGLAAKFSIATQPTAPSASGGTLISQPILSITDQYGNGTTNPYANVVVTASVGGTGAWTLQGSTVQTAVGGFAAFTNLSAIVNGSSTVSNAFITFSVAGYPLVTTTNSSTFNIGKPAAPFTPGNLAVLQIDSVANNTTFSIIEVRPSNAGQTSPVNIAPVTATGPTGLRQSSSGSTGRLALSDDGTLVCFSAFVDDSSATVDQTLNLNRAAAGMNAANAVTLGLQYVSSSLGGSQARAACTLDNMNWIADDKGGLYYGNSNSPAVNINGNNNIVVKTFGGVPYVETQKTSGGSPIPVVYSLDPHDPTVTVPNNLGTDQIATDFYLVSTNAGLTFDVLYIIDQVSSAQGIIKKYSWVPDSSQVSGFGWTNNGAFTNSNGADGLFAATNGVGAVYLYYTTGGGGSGGNSIVRLTDASAWNQNMNIVASNVIFTASSSSSLKGLTFVPQQTVYAPEPTPSPVLIAQSGATVSGQFSITNSPDDAAWRSAITGITVNGSPLPALAYDTTQAGRIVLNPTQSALLQTSGSKTIGVTATGYSANSVVQALASGPAAQLLITTQPKGPLGNGGVLTNQPAVKALDTYGNPVTSAISITAAAVESNWILGGSKTVATSGGTAAYSGLSAFSTGSVASATIAFSFNGLSVTSSPAFSIPAPIQSTLAITAASGHATFTFTNITGLSYSVVATNDLSTPVSSWPVIGSAVESPVGSGKYQFTDLAPSTNSVRFYLLRQP